MARPPTKLYDAIARALQFDNKRPGTSLEAQSTGGSREGCVAFSLNLESSSQNVLVKN
jgi:hypothetical protein